VLSEHKHCDNAATDANSENARSRMVATSVGKGGCGDKEDESSTERVWAAGFHHVMARFLLACVVKLMNRVFLYFANSFSGRGKPRILDQWIRGHDSIPKLISSATVT
jgi:hypothetical protein